MTHPNPAADRFQYARAYDLWLAGGIQRSYEEFRKEQLRRERRRHIASGVIVPAYAMKPQLLIRDDSVKGGWKPEIKHG